MLQSLTSFFQFGNRFCGIEHTIQNNQEVLYATVLKKSKRTIEVEYTFETSSLEDFSKKLSKKQHLFLVVNNDNVLTKRIESNQAEVIKLVYNAFPNINLEDFFYEVTSQKSYHFISICRKQYVKELISTYKSKGFPVINVSLGNTIISSITDFIDSQTVVSSNARISMDNKTITIIEKTDIIKTHNYDINGLKTNHNYILSLSGALDTVLQHFHSITNFDVLKHSLKNNHQQSQFFTQFLKLGLAFILSLLLINFFVFNHYFNQVNRLQQTSQMNQTTKQNILELSEQVNKSQKTADDMLKSSSSKSSFYVNNIIQSLPNSILLSELNYQPIEKRIKSDKPIVLKQNTIIVSGGSNRSDFFSKWITHLETALWINRVEILSYEDASKSVSKFSIKLHMTHDKQN